jgi:putative aldouronate transport system substrate-binding protein
VVSADENNLADPDQWKKVYEGYANATLSDTQGFSFDTDVMEAERSVLSALWNNHLSELVTGSADPDEVIAAVRQDMENAGLQRVQEEAQRQLDEYLKARQ